MKQKGPGAAMPIKKLTLLRHAKAVPAVPGMDDHARMLNGRGRAAAAQVGIETAGARPDLVLCSDAARTRETWEILSHTWERLPPVLFEAALYLAESEALLGRLRRIAPEISHAWLIGHNPGLEDLAGRLVAHGVGLPTAARARIEFEAPDWRMLGTVPVRRADFFRPARD
jgi:phosphohistidine phosphatase